MIFRRIFAAFVLLGAFASPVLAQSTKAQLNSQIGVNFPDNTSNEIAPLNLRNVTAGIVNSTLPTAPVVSGDLVAFDGTTGLPKDSGIAASSLTTCPAVGAFVVGTGSGVQCSTVIGATAILGGTMTISPTASTNTPGITIVQSTPNAGTPAGPITLNGITVIDGTQTVSGGFPQDQWGQITNQTDVFRINYQVTGGSANHFGFNVATNVTGSNGGTVPIISGCYVNVGPITGDCWVNLAVGTVGPSGNLNQSLIGYEAEMAVADTGVLRDRVGFSANSQGPTVATRYDEAYSINTFNLGAAHYLTAAPWSNGIHANSGLYGGSFPIAATGNFILADTGTVANFISAHTLTVTGNAIDLPNVNITGAGSMALGVGSSATTNQITVRCATCGIAGTFVNPNGTAGVDYTEVADSSGNNTLFLLVGEAANNSTRFGQTFGNWAEVAAQGTTNAGLMLGTVASAPLILGTNNIARVTIAGGGSVGISAPVVITSGSAGALQIGANGATNPAFQVDDSASSAATGIYILSAAAGNGATITATSSATNENLGLNAKGSGSIILGTSSTGPISILRALTYGSATLNNACTGCAGGNLVGSASPTIATPVINGLPTGTGVATAATASTLVARDGSGNFAAGTITASLTGHASLDLALTALGANVSAALGNAIGASGGLYALGGAINTSPKSFLDINANTSSSPALVTATDVARFQSVDGANGGFEFVSYGGANGNIVTGAAANGTSASPTASSAGTNLFNFHGTGWNGSSWQTGGIIVIHPTSTWSGTNQETQTDFYTTPLNTTSTALAGKFASSGGFTVGNTFDPGVGGINANAGFYAGSTAGLASKSCLINTANVTTGITLTIKGGIITGTTTC